MVDLAPEVPGPSSYFLHDTKRKFSCISQHIAAKIFTTEKCNVFQQPEMDVLGGSNEFSMINILLRSSVKITQDKNMYLNLSFFMYTFFVFSRFKNSHRIFMREWLHWNFSNLLEILRKKNKKFESFSCLGSTRRVCRYLTCEALCMLLEKVGKNSINQGHSGPPKFSVICLGRS